MTDDPSGKTGADASRRLLAQSEQSLRDLLDALDTVTDRTRAGEILNDADISGAVMALAHTRTMVIEEIQTNDKRGQLAGGDLSNSSHDFDAVRGELGRQLDRIRNARRTGGVSE